MAALAEAFVRVGLNTVGLGGALGRLKSTLTGTFRTIAHGLMAGPLGMVMGGGPRGPLLFGGYKILQTAASFEQAMTDSLVIMKGATGMYDILAAKADETARELGLSHESVAKSYFYLASAGLDAKRSLVAMPVVARFARAGNMDMAQSTTLLADAQSALGLKTEDATQYMQNMTRVSDALTQANILANATIQQFSEALTNKAGAALRMVNKDVEEGLAVLAVFADQGIKGAEAGTALGIVMRDLQTKAIDNAKEFKKAGVSVYTATGAMRPFADIIGDLEQRFGGMSDEQKKTSLLQLGFSDRSVAFTQVLLGTSDAMRGYEKELRKAGGSTKRIAEQMAGTFLGQWMKLRESIVGLVIGIGTPLMNALKPLVEGLAREIPKITARIDKFFADNKARFQAWGESIKTMWRNLWSAMVGTGIGGALNELGKNLMDKIGKVLNLASILTADPGGAWEYLKNRLSYIVQYLSQALVGALVGGAKAFMEAMLWVIRVLYEKLSDIFIAGAEGISAALTPGGKSAGEAFADALVQRQQERLEQLLGSEAGAGSIPKEYRSRLTERFQAVQAARAVEEKARLALSKSETGYFTKEVLSDRFKAARKAREEAERAFGAQARRVLPRDVQESMLAGTRPKLGEMFTKPLIERVSKWMAGDEAKRLDQEAAGMINRMTRMRDAKKLMYTVTDWWEMIYGSTKSYADTAKQLLAKRAPELGARAVAESAGLFPTMLGAGAGRGAGGPVSLAMGAYYMARGLMSGGLVAKAAKAGELPQTYNATVAALAKQERIAYKGGFVGIQDLGKSIQEALFKSDKDDAAKKTAANTGAMKEDTKNMSKGITDMAAKMITGAVAFVGGAGQGIP